MLVSDLGPLHDNLRLARALPVGSSDGQGWKMEYDLRAVFGRANVHVASELTHSFPHASDADARAFGLDLSQLFSRFVRRPLGLGLSANF